MHTLLLRHKGKAVCAAVVRVFGEAMAEMPLIATRYDARRQGHAKVLVRALEAMLAGMGIQVRARLGGGHVVCLPGGRSRIAR
jgi:N-acetylglutamate synthase-like GNAT family acetyltransferase